MKTNWLSSLVLGLTIATAGCAMSRGAGVDLNPDTYNAWDANRDGCLAQNEFGVGWNDQFGVWDDDESGIIDTNEFGVGVGTNVTDFGVFDDWDANDNFGIDTNEFGVGSFGVFDDNKDNCIGLNEWNAGVGFWD